MVAFKKGWCVIANELSLQAVLTYTKGTGDARVNVNKSYTDLVTVTGDEYQQFVQSVGTSAEAIPLGDVGTAGFVMLRNLDTTNFITISTDAAAHANPCNKMFPGEFCLFRAAAAPYAKADTAACRMEVTIIET